MKKWWQILWVSKEQKELEQKIANLTNENQFKADQAAVQAAQMEMLTTN